MKATGRPDLDYKGIYLKKPEPLRKPDEHLGEIKLNGRPYVEITGERNGAIFAELNVVAIHSSISHETDYAIAFVTLETE